MPRQGQVRATHQHCEYQRAHIHDLTRGLDFLSTIPDRSLQKNWFALAAGKSTQDHGIKRVFQFQHARSKRVWGVVA